MNRTVKVTGFSLRSRTVYKLSYLFSRVGQIQKVYLSPDKNAAFIRFEYQTAVDFVLDQEWRLGGETLKVRPVVSTRKDSSPARVPLNDPDTSEYLAAGQGTYCYNDYILTRNKYWIDFLHEGLGTVVCKKKKRKRKYNVCGDVSFQTCAPHVGKCTKKVKKHRKQKKKCAYLESAASLPFGVNACVSKERLEVYLKGSATIPLSVPMAVTAKDFLAVAAEATKIPPQLLHITFSGMVLSDKALKEIQDGSTFHYTVKGLGGSDSGEAELAGKQKAENLKADGNKKASSLLQETETPTNEDPGRSKGQEGALSKSAKKRLRKGAMKESQEEMKQVQKESAADSVKPECTANKSLDPEKVIEDGDQELATDQATKSSSKVGKQLTDRGDASLNIQPSGPLTDQYTAEEVQHWLQYTCRLTEDCLCQLKGLDGEVLFAYENDFSVLAYDTKIPTGVARKIFFLRDNPSCQSKILVWAVEEVIQFFDSFIKGQDWSKVKKNQIDGPAFLSYKMEDVAEAAEDFKVKKMIAFQILRGKQNILDEEEKENTNCTEPKHEDHFLQQETSESFPETQDAFTAAASSTANEGQSTKCVKLEKDDPFTQYKLYLQDTLHLQPLETYPDSKPLVKCEINVLYHKRKDLNRLEQQFMFLVLCKPDFCRGKSAKGALEKLWMLITENVHLKWVPLLPPDVLKTFCLETNRVLFEGKSLCFEKQTTKLSNMIEFDRTVRGLHKCTIPIMIIDRNLLEEKSSGYTLTLKKNKQASSFPFGFDKNRDYWLFHSLDFGWGFNRLKVDDSALGTLPRCIYRDNADTGKLSSDVCAEKEQPCHQNAYEQKREENPQLCPQNVSEEEPEQSPTDPSSKEILPDMSSSQTDEGFLEEESSIASANVDQMKSESEEAECSECPKYVNPRPFKKQAWKYSQGILRAVESGDNMLSRAVEFKFQAGCPPEDPKAFRSFLYKSMEFVCACLNARKNGTIYFGIAEKPIGEQIFRYGEIHGIDMDQSLCAKYYDSFYNEFLQKCFPSCFELVKLCLTGPNFVPVEKTNKYVIEIDVEPAYKQTKQHIFRFEPRQIFEKYGPPKQAEKSAPGTKKEEHVYLKNQNRWTGIFRRDGSETKYIVESQTVVFEMTVFPEICNKRLQEEDAEAKAHRVDMNSPEAEKLKQFIGECDSSMFPILLLPKLSEEERTSIQFFEFLHYIRWSAIFDFDNESERHGIYSFAKSSNLAFEVHESVVSDFKDMSVEDRKDNLSFPKKTVWLFTNGKTGSNAFQRLEQKEWEDCNWTFIQNAVAFYKDNSVIAPVRRLVLILVNKNDAGVMETSRDLKTAFGWRCVFFVFQDESERQIFARELSHDIIEHSVVMPWKHVHHVICQCLKLKSQDEDKYVHTSSGASVPVPFSEWQSWSDLDVLSVSECQREWDGFTPEQRNKKAEDEEIKFYQGKPVSWWNLFFTKLGYNHVMDRTICPKLITHIEKKIKIAEKDSDVTSIVTLSHMPAAGGTTLGKSLLWTLKDKYKCAVLKNITSYTERQVTQFWESGEEGCDRQQLPPVILLADNLASEESLLNEFELSRRLYRRQLEMQLVRPLAILIHCNRTMTLEGKFQLPQKLTEDEESWMEVKTETLEKQHPEGLGYFIALLAMRNGFDQEFLCSAINQYLDQNVLDENEREVIEYVALITTYFPSSRGLPGLPVTSFDTLMRNFKADTANHLPWEKTLSKVAKVILIIESKSPRIVVRIANQPYAKAVLDTCLRKNSETLSDIVVRCLKSHLVSNASHSLKEVHGLLTQMIIERQFKELSRMTHMSPLIMEIQSTDFNKAVEVLQLGYKTLKNEVFHQQLARLYMSDNQLDKAKTCAQKAVELSPEKRDFKHTLGVVYLRQFDAQKSNPASRDDPDERSKLLRVGILALKNFIEAQGKTGDDALSVCFSYAQTIEIVNKILQFLLDLIPVERAYKLGLYLVQSDYTDCELFDGLEETERKTMKTLLIEGIKALRFLFYLAYSNTIAKRDASFQFSKDQRNMDKVTESCGKPMGIFAAGVRRLRLKPDRTSIVENKDNFLRFANVKLKGCFFETIFLKIKLLHSSRGKKKKRNISDLFEIQKNLEDIHEKSCTDLDNLMTVYLALQIAREKPLFTLNKSKIYGFCNKIIRSDLDHSDTRYMRAHLYRVLVSWPQKYWEGFLEEEFKRSFQHKSSPLQGKSEPLLPKVQFYVTKESESSRSVGFHLCHWTEIYDETEREPPLDVMSQRLKTFKGDYKLRKNRGGDQFSSIEMKWQSAAGELNLTVWKIRGEKVFREECVEFYLGFSLHGPVAIIHRVLGD